MFCIQCEERYSYETCLDWFFVHSSIHETLCRSWQAVVQNLLSSDETEWSRGKAILLYLLDPENCGVQFHSMGIKMLRSENREQSLLLLIPINACSRNVKTYFDFLDCCICIAMFQSDCDLWFDRILFFYKNVIMHKVNNTVQYSTLLHCN